MITIKHIWHKFSDRQPLPLIPIWFKRKWSVTILAVITVEGAMCVEGKYLSKEDWEDYQWSYVDQDLENVPE